MSHKYLPINISVENRRILVVGGGRIALRKVENLLNYTAKITVIAPEPIDAIIRHASDSKLTLHRRPYRSPEASDYDLAISASDDEQVNRTVYDDCLQSGVLVNVVDNPALCTFTFPATVRRDCLSLAVSTDGKAPFLSAHLRLAVDELFPEYWGDVARLAARYRLMVLEKWPHNPEQRMAALKRFLAFDWQNVLQGKDERELDEILVNMLDKAGQPDAADDDDDSDRSSS